MKRAFALAALLAVAIALVLWLTRSAEIAPAETREPPVAQAERLQTLDASSTELSRAPGNAVPDSNPPIEGDAPPQRAVASARAPIVLFGTFTDASGKAFRTVPGCVRITGMHGDARLTPIHGGAYSIEGLAPGAFDIGVEAPGFRRVARTIRLEAGETEHREDIALDPVWTIAVRFLTPDGRNFLDRKLEREIPSGERLWAVATTSQPLERLPPGVSRYRSPRSRWMESSGSAGFLDVDATPPMYVSAVVSDRVVATKLVDASVDQVTIEIPLERLKAIGCGVKGRVVDGTSLLPLPNTMVSLAGPWGRQFRTDAAGEFAADGLLPGAYTLSITRTPEYAVDLRRIELASDRQNDLGTIPLEPSVALRGRCVDPQGRPARADVQLSPYLSEHPFEYPQSQFGMETDTSGRFELGMCAHRVYVLRVRLSMAEGVNSLDWCARERIVDLTGGPIDDLVVSVHVAVDLMLHPTTDDVRQLRYWIFTPEGILARNGEFADSGVDREKLAPGSYKLLLGEEASIVREIPFTLGEEPMTLDVRL